VFPVKRTRYETLKRKSLLFLRKRVKTHSNVAIQLIIFPGGPRTPALRKRGGEEKRRVGVERGGKGGEGKEGVPPLLISKSNNCAYNITYYFFRYNCVRHGS
jgi:hypothetical protein